MNINIPWSWIQTSSNGSSKQGSDKILPTPGSKDSPGESGDVSPGTRLRRNIFKLKFHSRDSAGMAPDDLANDDGKDGKARRMSVFKFGTFQCIFVCTYDNGEICLNQCLIIGYIITWQLLCLVTPVLVHRKAAICYSIMGYI